MTVESITEWDTCIVRIPAFSRSSAEHQHFSVSSYEDARRRAPGLNPQALAFWGLGWALSAPTVEKLTTDESNLRIGDWEIYCAQMDRMLGLV